MEGEVKNEQGCPHALHPALAASTSRGEPRACPRNPISPRGMQILSSCITGFGGGGWGGLTPS